MAIYKILRDSEWQALRAQGVTQGSAADLSDGFIHFSTAEQTHETLERHFAGDESLWILQVEEAALGDRLQWEPARGGQLFPHLYGDLEIAHVEAAERVVPGDPLPFGLS